MTDPSAARENLLASLDATIADAELFFARVPESLCEGRQSAREALAHLVFWHAEYVHIAEALADGRPYHLRRGTSNELNALAARQLRDEPMPVLARRLTYRQKKLAKQLSRIRDWSINFPVKEGGDYCSISVRVAEIEAHVRGHVGRLRRAARQQGVQAALSYSTVDLFAPSTVGRHLQRLGSLI
jgi:hypothetical protein